MRLATIGLAALAACTDISSEDITTDGVYADLSVTARGDGTSQAFAVLKAGGNSTTYVELTGDDQLTATLGDDTRDMEPYELLDWHGYQASFDLAPVDEDYVISFVRSSDGGAPHSMIRLPAELALDPAPDISRAADWSITWGPTADEEILVEVTGDCFVPFYDTLDDDPGTYTLTAGSLEPHEDEVDATCDAEVRIHRRRPGTVDPGYGEGGTAWGVQERATTVACTP